MKESFIKFIDIFSNQIFLLQLIVAIAILLLSFMLRKLFIGYIISYFNASFGSIQTQPEENEEKSEKENEVKVNLLRSFTTPLGSSFIILGLYCISTILNLPKDVDAFLDQIFNTLLLMTLFLTLYRMLGPLAFLFDKFSTGLLESNLYQEMKGLVVAVLKAFILVAGSLSIFQKWGVNVGAFLAGLGLVGMAVVLAAQDTMRNFFGSLAVLMDQTFVKGDWIQTPDVEGVVESVGLRTTIIRRFDKALVTIPNASLANAAIINFSRMTHRRIAWKVGLTGGASSLQLKRIVKHMRQYLETHSEIETDPAKAITVAYLDQLENSTLGIFCCCFTKTTEWVEYMRVKEEILLAFRDIIQKEKGEISLVQVIPSPYLGQ